MKQFFKRILQSKPMWLAYRHLRKIWVRVVAFALFAVFTAVVAQLLGGLIPEDLATKLGGDAVDQVLSILATSMLAVTTFSLSISVSAYASAAQTATPRATALLQEDNTTQNVLATFLGAFLFSLVGIVALKAGYYSAAGRLVLFVATALTMALVVVALIRWISHLTDFGRMADTLDRVERAAGTAIERRMQAPWLGGRPQDMPPPEDGLRISAQEVGFVQHIDTEALSDAAEDLDTRVWVAALPGTFVHSGAPLLVTDRRDLDEAAQAKLRAAISCGPQREFSQDPGFGLTVMSEIASRALSPAVNDPGTAVDVISRLTRLLAKWTTDCAPTDACHNVYVPTLTVDDLMDVSFRPITRDGAAFFEVHLSLQEAFRALSVGDPDSFSAVAARWSVEAQEKMDKSVFNAREMKLLHDVALKPV